MIGLKEVKDFTRYGVDHGNDGIKTLTDGYHTWNWVLRYGKGFFKTDSGELVQAELISHTGGYEEDEEECTSILKIGDQYFKFDYGYRSSDGYDYTWMDVREVKPVQKVVTVYE